MIESFRVCSSAVRVLLLTDIPPSTNYSGGLHIAQLCRLLPPGALDVFAIVNPNLTPTLPDDLASIAIRYEEKPNEYAWRPRSGAIASAGALLSESYRAATARRHVADTALRHVRDVNPDVVWCLLEGQTMIQVGARVRARTKCAFVTQVMDPPRWWLTAHGLDRLSKRRVFAQFDSVISGSDRCGTASWAMADRYRELYGVETIPLVPSIDEDEVAANPETKDSTRPLLVGLAGQIYAQDAWAALVSALNSADWKVAGRDVVVRALGLSNWTAEYALRAVRPDLALPQDGVEFYDWREQREAIALLAECDILYCPYWFAPEFEEEARLSFPSKLTSYLAAGRPVLFHGPAYASPATFLEREQAGVCCLSLDQKEVLATLTAIATDGALRDRVTSNGRAALREHLSVRAQRAHFARFLGFDEGSFVDASSL